MTPPMHAVKSSHIAEIGHVGGKLRVKFRDGATYEYADVPDELFKKLAGADSVGGFFSKHIRGHHVGKRLDG